MQEQIKAAVPPQHGQQAKQRSASRKTQQNGIAAAKEASALKTAIMHCKRQTLTSKQTKQAIQCRVHRAPLDWTLSILVKIIYRLPPLPPTPSPLFGEPFVAVQHVLF